MKRLLSVLSTFLLLNICQASLAQSKPDAIIGDWITTDRNAIIRCYKDGNKYFGKVLWYEAFKEEEEGHSIDPADNTRFLNTICMKDFVFDKNEWAGGRIIDAYHNKSYSAFARFNDKQQLEVTGYILFRWLSQTMILEKASPEIIEKYTKNIITNR